MLFEELKRVSIDLNALNVRWCLIGGMAVGFYSEPRTTKDLDVAILLDDDSKVRSLVDQLCKLGYTAPSILMNTDSMTRMGWRIHIPTRKAHEVPLDLLSGSCGIEREIVEAATNVDLVPAISVPMVGRGHLMAMKILSENEWDRLRDRSDLIQLLQEATEEDLNLARSSVQLITERGYNRGKDLAATLNSLVEKSRSFKGSR